MLSSRIWKNQVAMRLLAKQRIKIPSLCLTSEFSNASAANNSKNSSGKRLKMYTTWVQVRHSSNTTIYARDVSSSSMNSLTDTLVNLSDFLRTRCLSQMLSKWKNLQIISTSWGFTSLSITRATSHRKGMENKVKVILKSSIVWWQSFSLSWHEPSVRLLVDSKLSTAKTNSLSKYSNSSLLCVFPKSLVRVVSLFPSA